MQVHKFYKSKFITVHNAMQVHKFHTHVHRTVSHKLIEDASFHKFLLRAHLWMSDTAGRRSTAGGWRWIPDRGDGNGEAWPEEMEMQGVPAAPCCLGHEHERAWPSAPVVRITKNLISNISRSRAQEHCEIHHAMRNNPEYIMKRLNIL